MDQIFTKQLNNLAETQRFGEMIGAFLHPGDILLLCGELGTGKTALSKSVCKALGVNPDSVISPTYTIVNMYQGTMTVYHLDLYRLQSSEDLNNFDWDDLIAADGVTLVEWPELLIPLLSDEPLLRLSLTHLSETSRMVELTGHSRHFKALFQAAFASEPAQPHSLV